MARNQHGRHGTTEIFHASVLLQTQYHSWKWIHKKILLFYVQLVKHDLQFDLLFARKQNAHDAIHQHKLL